MKEQGQKKHERNMKEKGQKALEKRRPRSSP